MIFLAVSLSFLVSLNTNVFAQADFLLGRNDVNINTSDPSTDQVFSNEDNFFFAADDQQQSPELASDDSSLFLDHQDPFFLSESDINDDAFLLANCPNDGSVSPSKKLKSRDSAASVLHTTATRSKFPNFLTY